MVDASQLIDLENRLGNISSDLNVLQRNVDVAFEFVTGDTVLLLQAGFAFLQCGVVRTKNTTNILLVTLCDLYLSGISFFLVGWAFYRGSGNFFIGWTQFALVGIDYDQLCDWFFQCVVAALVATIVSGAVAERCNFIAHGIFSCVISGFIYPVVAHWAWHKEGWLNRGYGDYKFVDFAGSGVVHLVGGVCSFVAAYMIGPRTGRFDATGKPREMKGHSMPITALGGFILVFGMVAFNAGAQRHISRGGDGPAVALAISNTVISGSFGCVLSLFVYKSGVLGNPRQWSFLPTFNGTIIAMIATCAGGNELPQWAAAIIGLLSTPVYFSIRALVLRLKVDDPLDATAVHFGGGAWGLLASTIFARRHSLIYSDFPLRGYWLLWTLVGFLSILVWSACTSLLLFGSMKKCSTLRVSPLVEDRGLDQNKHGEAAYPVGGWEEEQYNDFLDEDQPETPGVQQPTRFTRSSRNGILPVMTGSIRRDADKDVVGVSSDNSAFVPDIAIV